MGKRYQLRSGLGVNLSQRMTITPALLQNIKLLTLNRLELSDLLSQELANNPVLEEVSEQDDLDVLDRQKAEGMNGESDYENFDYEYFFGEYLSATPHSIGLEHPAEQIPVDFFLTTPSTLNDHLNWQLNLTEMSGQIRKIAEFIIGNIDENGYLMVTVEEISWALEVSTDQIEEALRGVQNLDPIGVGSRNLRECLLLQIRSADLGGSLAESLVQEHLSLVQTKKFNELAGVLNCSPEDVFLAVEKLKNFSPNPGAKYNSQRPHYIQPDIHIYKVDNDYQILLNNDGLPKLCLSKSYRELLRQKGISKDAKTFVRERFRAAMELLQGVDQRDQTVYRVCKVIVGHQKDFLDHGMASLKPLLIKDVAEEMGVHSSTVSRIVSNKYAYTPQGVVELRKFFSSGVVNTCGRAMSVVQVKEKIKGIVANENNESPFSDQRISALLNNRGIEITRRTVSKYRHQMGILDSRERKIAVLF